MFKNNEVSQVMGIIPCKIPHNLTIFPLFCLLDFRFKKNYELFLKKVRNFFDAFSCGNKFGFYRGIIEKGVMKSLHLSGEVAVASPQPEG